MHLILRRLPKLGGGGEGVPPFKGILVYLGYSTMLGNPHIEIMSEGFVRQSFRIRPNEGPRPHPELLTPTLRPLKVR